MWSDSVVPAPCACAVALSPINTPTATTMDTKLVVRRFTATPFLWMRLSVGDQVVECLLDLFLSLLKTGPAVVDCDDREGKVLHILQAKTILCSTLSDLVLQFRMFSF